VIRVPLAISLALGLTQPAAANGDEIKVWAARAIATVLTEIGPQFERATGHRLSISSDLPDAFRRRATAGERFDVLITGSDPVDEWIRDGRIAAETRANIARSGIGVEVRAGARKPDISSVDAFKRALLDARSIAYLRIGSGAYVATLLERLGIAEAVASKVTRPESDIVSELVAKGEVELGVVVITQILTTPGVDLVGPLPAEVQSYIVFTAGISANAQAPDAARQLITFLTGPTAAAVMKAQGMEPWSAADGIRMRQEPANYFSPAVHVTFRPAHPPDLWSVIVTPPCMPTRTRSLGDLSSQNRGPSPMRGLARAI
jgi:molybdate transport system substrate-binding protein